MHATCGNMFALLMMQLDHPSRPAPPPLQLEEHRPCCHTTHNCSRCQVSESQRVLRAQQASDAAAMQFFFKGMSALQLAVFSQKGSAEPLQVSQAPPAS